MSAHDPLQLIQKKKSIRHRFLEHNHTFFLLTTKENFGSTPTVYSNPSLTFLKLILFSNSSGEEQQDETFVAYGYGRLFRIRFRFCGRVSTHWALSCVFRFQLLADFTTENENPGEIIFDNEKCL